MVYFKTPIEEREDDLATFETLMRVLEEENAFHEKELEKALELADNLEKGSEKKGTKTKREAQLLEKAPQSLWEAEAHLHQFFDNPSQKKQVRGAERIKELLDHKQLHLADEIYAERAKLHGNVKVSKASLEKGARRLRILESFAFTKTKLGWMVLTVLPVLPPDLRPM